MSHWVIERTVTSILISMNFQLPHITRYDYNSMRILNIHNPSIGMISLERWRLQGDLIEEYEIMKDPTKLYS